MPLGLTPEEEAVYNNRVTDVPGEVFIPDPVDLANGDATGDDVTITPPSGLQQDIDGAQKGIEDSDARLIEKQTEQDMAEKVMNYYHGMLQAYQDEKKLTDGDYESSAWSPSEVSEANNIYNGTVTRYFPSGQSTVPLLAQSFPEETGGGATTNDPENLINRFPDLEAVIDTFVTNWTNPERISNNTTNPANQTQFDDEKDDIYDQLLVMLPIVLDTQTLLTPPFFDEVNTGADIDGAARKVEIDTLYTILDTLNTGTTFSDADLSAFQAERTSVIPEANLRLTTIGLYASPANYALRAQFAVELCEFGEGIIYSKLSEVVNNSELVTRKAKLERKLATYQGIGGIV